MKPNSQSVLIEVHLLENISGQEKVHLRIIYEQLRGCCKASPLVWCRAFVNRSAQGGIQTRKSRGNWGRQEGTKVRVEEDEGKGKERGRGRVGGGGS